MAAACLISPLAAQITCHLVVCPICYQSENHFRVCDACDQSQPKCSKPDSWNLSNSQCSVVSNEPELLLTYFKIFCDISPTCLNSLISECRPTLFYLFVTSRFAEDFFSLSATQSEGQAGIQTMPVFWNLMFPGFACYFRLLKTLCLQLICGRTILRSFLPRHFFGEKK